VEQMMREQIVEEVLHITPCDMLEKTHQDDALTWLHSDAEIYRIEKPAFPPKHLVSYFVVIDNEHVLLVDHKKARLWLPSGGHVERGEHPRDTVRREIQEELGIGAAFIQDAPLFITSTETVGETAGHVDVSLWYVVRGSRSDDVNYDESEFSGVQWFHYTDIPLEKSDPHMGRFIAKYYEEREV
jgi:8-oxo-dGTP diphosphatase